MKHSNNFDFLRVFAASIVIVGHSFALLNQPQPVFFGTHMAALGVVIFFSISGYLIAGSWLNEPSIVSYLQKRSLRIFPALVALVLLTTFVAGPILSSQSIREYFHSEYIGHYLMNAGLYINYRLPGVFDSNPYPIAVNGSLWSLPAEFAMYLVLPLALGAYFRKTLVVLLAVAMAVAAVLLDHRNQVVVIYATELKSTLAMGSYFMGGALLKLMKGNIRVTLPRAAVAFVAYAVLATFSTGRFQYLNAIVAAFAVPYAVIAIAESSALKLPNAALYGDFSYGLYLYAFPIQQALIFYFGPSIGLMTEIIASFALTLPCAILSWHVVEKTAMRFKPKAVRKISTEPVAQ